MKKFLILLLSVCYSVTLLANILTVSNRPESPAMFTDLQAAVDAATNGDTILITGSGTTYGGCNVPKKLCFLGQGYDPRKDVAFATRLSTLSFEVGSDSSWIEGFRVNIIYTNSAGVMIRRCYFDGGTSVLGGGGALFQENFVNYDASVNFAGSLSIVSNCIFTGYLQSQSTEGIIITNNYFCQPAAINAVNSIITNNVFYPKQPDLTDQPFFNNNQGFNPNCVYNNNIYYNTSNTDPFGITAGVNTGTGNFKANPLFVNFDSTQYSTFDLRTENLQLKNGSPAKNAGTDGKDIGSYGGAGSLQYPLSGEPNIPQVRTMTIGNSVIPPNGTLRVNLKANNGN